MNIYVFDIFVLYLLLDVVMLKISLKIPRSSIVRVAGPASLRVASGRISVLGKILQSGSEIFISLYKSYPLYSLDDSVVDIELGEGGYVENPREKDDVTIQWIETAEKVVEKGSRIVVMGPGESGKSTFSTLLLNTAINKGLKACVIDADIGQQDIGPPDFISMSCPSQTVQWLRELYPEEIRLIGVLTPSQYSHRIIAATIDLVSKALEKGAEVIIINTDGWVSSPYAIEMKLEIARFVKATHIIALQNGSYLGSLINISTPIKIMPLPSPQGVRTRSREDRRMLRAYAYKKFFDQAVLRSIDISRDFIIIGSCLASGEKLDQQKILELEKTIGTKILYGSRHEGVIYLYVQSPVKEYSEKSLKYQDHEIQIFVQGSERGLLASLLDSSLREIAPAIIDTLDLQNNVLKIVTRYEGPVSGVLIGRVKIDFSYDDSIRYTRCPI
jgi:polynucleotide 5'-hydroxyl-kinase GRC3/NOL9